MPCRYLRTVGWQEWICAISGASVGDRCGIGLEECIPLLAWRWVRGEVTFARITRGLGPRDITRRAVIAMAQRILEREGVPLDLQQMSEAELGDLAGPAAALRVAAPHRGAGEAGDGGDGGMNVAQGIGLRLAQGQPAWAGMLRQISLADAQQMVLANARAMEVATR